MLLLPLTVGMDTPDVVSNRTTQLSVDDDPPYRVCFDTGGEKVLTRQFKRQWAVTIIRQPFSTSDASPIVLMQLRILKMRVPPST